MISVLIVDDNEIVRDGLRKLISGERDMVVAGQASGGQAALTTLGGSQVIDVALVDFNMPGMDGVELIARIIKMKLRTKVIVLTMHTQTTFRDKALKAGANGYLLKGEDEEELFAGIRAVHAGNTFVSASFAR